MMIVETYVELGGRRFNGESGHFYIVKDGIDGWDDSPAVRNQRSIRAGSDGEVEPPEVLLDARQITLILRCLAVNQYAIEADIIPWAAALARRTDLQLVVNNAAGEQSARVWTDGRVKTRRLMQDWVEVEISLFAPDPVKYGKERRLRLDAATLAPAGLNWPPTAGVTGVPAYFDYTPFSTVGGFGINLFEFKNTGTADTWAIFEADGLIPGGLSITSDGDELRFERTIDPSGDQDRPALLLSPYAGGRAWMNGADRTTDLVRADWMKVPAGETRRFFVTALDDPSAGSYVQARFRSGWL